MAADPLVTTIRDELRATADPGRAPRMQAYMKSTMPFLGIPLPQVRRIANAAHDRHPVDDAGTLEHVVRALWDGATYREERYAAAALLRLPLAKGEPSLVPLYEDLAVSGAWWDHVDDLAGRVADLHDTHPDETAQVVRQWARDDDLWLNRLAIISQLGRRDRLDRALLVEVCEPHLVSKEFFLRKAIGWALRDYARVDPDWVRTYVAEREERISGLTKREALKHVG